MSVSYLNACKYRANNNYIRGCDELLRGATNHNLACILECYDMYSYGGWGVLPSKAKSHYYKSLAIRVSKGDITNEFFQRTFEPNAREASFLYFEELLKKRPDLRYILIPRLLTAANQEYRIQHKDLFIEFAEKNIANMIPTSVATMVNLNITMSQELIENTMKFVLIGTNQRHQASCRLYKFLAVTFKEQVEASGLRMTWADIRANNLNAIMAKMLTTTTQATADLTLREMWLIGRDVSVGLISERELVQSSAIGRFDVSQDVVNFAVNLYMSVVDMSRNATLTWILCAEKMGVLPCELIRLIGEDVWETREIPELWPIEINDE
jgi:hypothetical protein